MRDYLKSITEVCPFSLKHFDNGEIPILHYSEPLVRELYTELDKYPAILYPEAEWFWSHPDEGRNSTLVPVLIMQNREHLANARKEFKLNRNA